jgi:hypothetical protein
MLSPSLPVHYKHFITTTAKSAPCSSTTSIAVCFLIQFDRTLQGSLVLYYSLNTCLANLTPDVMYPVIRFLRDKWYSHFIHSRYTRRRYPRSYLFSTSSIALTRLHHWFTFVQLIVFVPAELAVSAFPYRSPPVPLGTRSIRWFGNYS